MISVKVVLFASLRESLGESVFSLDLVDGCRVCGLVDTLAKSRGQNWRDLLSAEKVLSAVNHTMVDAQQLLENGDEVAFFPPVTGG
ncbi:MAG: MoaD/ThiS family protein [bacterium]|nr:MoaD/ThiS family protein [Gammaproteobacteria bacterium]HIL96825.1 MoaD/ThiS family protein [Pseudomonadales bacterium]